MKLVEKLTALAARFEVWADEKMNCEPENAYVWRRASELLRFELERNDELATVTENGNASPATPGQEGEVALAAGSEVPRSEAAAGTGGDEAANDYRYGYVDGYAYGAGDRRRLECGLWTGNVARTLAWIGFAAEWSRAAYFSRDEDVGYALDDTLDWVRARILPAK